MKKVNGIILEAVRERERERESYTLLNKDSFNNICKKEIAIKLQKVVFLLLSFCV